MPHVDIELNGDQARCFRKYHCFANFSEASLKLPVGHLIQPSFEGVDLEKPAVAAIQQIDMRVESGNVAHGSLFIFASEMEVEAVNRGLTLIIEPEMAECYKKYGYVAVPSVREDALPIGGIVEFANAGLRLKPGTIVAVQKCMPIWRYLFIIVKPQG